MLFNSYAFIFGFTPIVVAIYWIFAMASKRSLLPVLWLCAASYFFYIMGARNYGWLIATSIIFNFICGYAICASQGRVRLSVLIIGIAGDLVTLGYYKYAHFVVQQLNAAGLVDTAPPDIALPIGISFYTFTQIAFLVDCYKRLSGNHRPTNYFAFVTFFPHLIAGPILHHREMISQFERIGRFRIGWYLYVGVALFTIGLAKKVLIADGVAPIASAVFGAAQGQQDPTLINAWAGALAYTVQIYFDFSGYSDMALGLALMLGLKLPYNFNSPYKSTNLIQFWRRWHITLSRFLKDYVYIPLGGNRKGRARRHVNLFATMVIGGAWHGAGWTFIIWGAMHGAMLFIAHLWNELVRNGKTPPLPPLASWMLTFVAIVLAWVAFRAPDMQTAVRIWRGLAGLNGVALPDNEFLQALTPHLGLSIEPHLFDGKAAGLVVLGLLIAFLAPNSQQMMRRFRVGLDSPRYRAHGERPAWPSMMFRLDWRWALAIGCLLGLVVRFAQGYSEFIYFQF